MLINYAKIGYEMTPLLVFDVLRRGTEIRCTIDRGGHKQRLRSCTKLLGELLKSPLNSSTR